MGKRVILSGYFGFKNFGDEVILSVLIDKLKQYNCDITVITSNPEYTKSIHKNIKCVKSFALFNILKGIYKSEILISGGGSLLQDATSLKSLIYYLFVIFLGLILNKKVLIFAQGIGPINSSFGAFLTKNILKHCTYLSVRDKRSFKLLENWGIKSDLLCDPAFSLNVSKEKTNTVAIQLRNFKTMNNDFLDRLAKSVYDNFKDKNIEIYSFQDDIDLDICNLFSEKLQMLCSDLNLKVYNNLSNREIIEKISKAEYLIAMRFHAIIIGLLANSRILAINYDIKVEEISSEFNLPVINLNSDFGNSFEKLYNQNLNVNKIFDWSSFEKFLK